MLEQSPGPPSGTQPTPLDAGSALSSAVSRCYPVLVAALSRHFGTFLLGTSSVYLRDSKSCWSFKLLYYYNLLLQISFKKSQNRFCIVAKNFKREKVKSFNMHCRNIATAIYTDSSHIPFLLVTMAHFNGPKACARCTQSSVIRIRFQPCFTPCWCHPNRNMLPAAESRERKWKQRDLTRGQHAADPGWDTTSVNPTMTLLDLVTLAFWTACFS